MDNFIVFVSLQHTQTVINPVKNIEIFHKLTPFWPKMSIFYKCFSVCINRAMGSIWKHNMKFGVRCAQQHYCSENFDRRTMKIASGVETGWTAFGSWKGMCLTQLFRTLLNLNRLVNFNNHACNTSCMQVSVLLCTSKPEHENVAPEVQFNVLFYKSYKSLYYGLKILTIFFTIFASRSSHIWPSASDLCLCIFVLHIHNKTQ